MTRKEIIERNISLTFDFVHHIIDNEPEINELPSDFDIEFIDKDFPRVEMKIEGIDALSEPEVPPKYITIKRTFSLS